MRRQQLTADAALLFVTAVWGATFVMVQEAVTGFPVFAFLSLRFIMATAVLLPLFLRFRRSWQPGNVGAASSVVVQSEKVRTGQTRLLPGIVIGLALFAGYAFQTFGLRATTPALAGFITGLSVVLVPLGETLFLRRPPGRNAIVGVGLAAVGLALLSLQSDLSVSFGDLLVLCCAVAFAAHILLVGHFAPSWPPLRLAFVQIATVAVVSSLAALSVDRPIGWPAGNVWFAAAFTGLFATALAFFYSKSRPASHHVHAHRPDLRRGAGVCGHLQLLAHRRGARPAPNPSAVR